MTKGFSPEDTQLLCEAILSLQTVDECRRFLSDLCTVGELRAMLQSFNQRFEVALLLSEGKIYNDIMSRTGASSATISRVNRSLQYGAGGYDAVFPRIIEKARADGKL